MRLLNWKSILIQTVFRYFTEAVTLIMLVKIIILQISKSNYMDTISTTNLVAFLLVNLGIKTLVALYAHWRATTYPGCWGKGTVKKMRKYKKDTFRWKETQLSHIRVGDILRLRYLEVAPCDLLILDTSEQRYNDSILKTNERRIKGENRIRIKRAVRNLDMKSNSTNQTSATDYLGGLTKKLNGYIEYDPPSGLVETFSGIFKLKNDPKVTKVTEDNILFCGTKLYSKE